MRRAARGSTLVELLVASAVAMLVLGTLTVAVAVGARVLRQAAARSELEDIVQLAVEAFAFDVRRAGYDPRATGFEPLASAKTDELTVLADLDDDGAVDANSEETVSYRCTPPPRRLSRLVGAQSLPLSDGVVTCGFRYLDDSGVPLVVPVAGLDPIERARVRAVELALVLASPGLPARAARTIVIALRTST